MKNQGQCSSCLTLSTTGALEKALAVDNGWTQTMSEQQLVDCDTVNYALSVTWRSHREVSRKQGHVHRQRAGFEISSSTATRVILKTFVERHGAQTKASDGRINLPGTGTSVSWMMRKQPMVWKSALSRRRAEHSPYSLYSEQFRTHSSG